MILLPKIKKFFDDFIDRVSVSNFGTRPTLKRSRESVVPHLILNSYFIQLLRKLK